MRLELIAQSSSKSTGQHPPELNQVLLVHQLRAMLHRFEQILSFQTQNAFLCLGQAWSKQESGLPTAPMSFGLS